MENINLRDKLAGLVLPFAVEECENNNCFGILEQVTMAYKYANAMLAVRIEMEEE